MLVISQDLLAKRELVLAITVTSTRGRVVVGRAQEYLTSVGRAGFTMTLGAPSLGDQFYFADGEVGPNVVAERYSIYNASETEAVVNVAFLGLDPALGFVNPEPITVEPGKVASLIADDVGVPAGRHGAVFSTETDGSILVERAITRITEDTVCDHGGDGRAARVRIDPLEHGDRHRPGRRQRARRAECDRLRRRRSP